MMGSHMLDSHSLGVKEKLYGSCNIPSVGLVPGRVSMFCSL